MNDPRSPDRERQLPDFQLVRMRTIPWSADEFWAVVEHEMRLIHTPQDDWDRHPRGVTLDVGRGPEIYRFNPDVRANQVMSFMTERYRAQGATVSASHMNRYLTIKEFLQVYHDRLVADRLVQPGDGGEEGVASALIEVLAKARFDATHTNLGGHEVPTFDYAAIAAEARRRMDAEDAADPEGGTGSDD